MRNPLHSQLLVHGLAPRSQLGEDDGTEFREKEEVALGPSSSSVRRSARG